MTAHNAERGVIVGLDQIGVKTGLGIFYLALRFGLDFQRDFRGNAEFFRFEKLVVVNAAPDRGLHGLAGSRFRVKIEVFRIPQAFITVKTVAHQPVRAIGDCQIAL